MKLVHIGSILESPNTHRFGQCVQKGGLPHSISALQDQAFAIPAILFHSELQAFRVLRLREIINEINVVFNNFGLFAEVVEIFDPFLNFLYEVGLKKFGIGPGSIFLAPQRSSISMKILIQARKHKFLSQEGLGTKQIIEYLDAFAFLQYLSKLRLL